MQACKSCPRHAESNRSKSVPRNNQCITNCLNPQQQSAPRKSVGSNGARRKHSQVSPVEPRLLPPGGDTGISRASVPTNGQKLPSYQSFGTQTKTRPSIESNARNTLQQLPAGSFVGRQTQQNGSLPPGEQAPCAQFSMPPWTAPQPEQRTSRPAPPPSPSLPMNIVVTLESSDQKGGAEEITWPQTNTQSPVGRQPALSPGSGNRQNSGGCGCNQGGRQERSKSGSRKSGKACSFNLPAKHAPAAGAGCPPEQTGAYEPQPDVGPCNGNQNQGRPTPCSGRRRSKSQNVNPRAPPLEQVYSKDKRKRCQNNGANPPCVGGPRPPRSKSQERKACTRHSMQGPVDSNGGGGADGSSPPRKSSASRKSNSCPHRNSQQQDAPPPPPETPQETAPGSEKFPSGELGSAAGAELSNQSQMSSKSKSITSQSSKMSGSTTSSKPVKVQTDADDLRAKITQYIKNRFDLVKGPTGPLTPYRDPREGEEECLEPPPPPTPPPEIDEELERRLREEQERARLEMERMQLEAEVESLKGAMPLNLSCDEQLKYLSCMGASEKAIDVFRELQQAAMEEKERALQAEVETWKTKIPMNLPCEAQIAFLTCMGASEDVKEEFVRLQEEAEEAAAAKAAADAATQLCACMAANAAKEKKNNQGKKMAQPCNTSRASFQGGVQGQLQAKEQFLNSIGKPDCSPKAQSQAPCPPAPPSSPPAAEECADDGGEEDLYELLRKCREEMAAAGVCPPPGGRKSSGSGCSGTLQRHTLLQEQPEAIINLPVDDVDMLKSIAERRPTPFPSEFEEASKSINANLSNVPVEEEFEGDTESDMHHPMFGKLEEPPELSLADEITMYKTHLANLRRRYFSEVVKEIDNVEGVTPTIAAAMVYTEELGLKMKAAPARIYEFLYPELPSQPIVNIGQVISNLPSGLDDIVVPLAPPMLLEASKYPGLEDPAMLDPPRFLQVGPALNLPDEPQMQVGAHAMDIKELVTGYTGADVGEIFYPELAEFGEDQDMNEFEKEALDVFNVRLQQSLPPHFSQIQTRGSAPPVWFPGYWTASPSRDGVWCTSKLCDIMEKIWEEVQPERIRPGGGANIIGE